MKLHFQIPDMACGACAENITKAITTVDATAVVTPDLATKWVTVETMAESTRITQAIAAAGYTITTK